MDRDRDTMGDYKFFPCSGCGIELKGRDYEETTTMVYVTEQPVFAGKRGQHEIPAAKCPECGEVTPF